MEVKVRLDRFVASSSWNNRFPASRVLHLNPSMSDHLPILLQVREHRPKKRRRKKRFRFEEFWLHDEDCKKMVELGWEGANGGTALTRVCNKLDSTRRVLLEWSTSKF